MGLFTLFTSSTKYQEYMMEQFKIIERFVISYKVSKNVQVALQQAMNKQLDPMKMLAQYQSQNQMNVDHIASATQSHIPQVQAQAVTAANQTSASQSPAIYPPHNQVEAAPNRNEQVRAATPEKENANPQKPSPSNVTYVNQEKSVNEKGQSYIYIEGKYYRYNPDNTYVVHGQTMYYEDKRHYSKDEVDNVTAGYAQANRINKVSNVKPVANSTYSNANFANSSAYQNPNSNNRTPGSYPPNMKNIMPNSPATTNAAAAQKQVQEYLERLNKNTE
ncbi:MAG: hypothetical protein ABL927_07280 [Bdellovibrionales bacterium]